MKRTIVAVAILFASFFSAVSVQAQDAARIGWANIEYIVSQMPDAKEIESELKAHNKQLENQLKAKYQEYQTKAQAYQKGAQTMTDAVRADKERELQQLQMSIQQFEREAQLELQRKQQQLLQPVYEKVQAAIEEVAKANNYTHVISNEAMGTPVLLFARDEDNLNDKILKQLGVTPKPTQE